jgi:hypothetical protein
VTEHILQAIIGLMAMLIVVIIGWSLVRLDQKLDRLISNFDGKFDGLSNPLGALEQQVAALNGWVDAFGQRLTRIETIK